MTNDNSIDGVRCHNESEMCLFFRSLDPVQRSSGHVSLRCARLNPTVPADGNDFDLTCAGVDPTWSFVEPECQGHETTRGPVGSTEYCDGSCELVRARWGHD